ncbi:Aldehyde dehydrogenase, dimeric NADP-preferring [Lobosporangium transversale]|nr:Aldehyde dehydrogenase, dimeric NADP-preferring [Lobosporangium transversale]
MDPEVVYIINGAVEESSLMLKQRFDHIFYTGGAQVAKIVMEAAAKHLTPVTLELGGKCPVIITEHADLAKAAQTIAGWKVANCGQICLTADYVLCPKHLQEELIKQVIDTWTHMFGKDIKACESYPRIINRRQHERLQKVLQSVQSQNKIVFGGNSDVDSLFVEPTIVTNVSLKDDIMQSEIFGPILPIVTCENLDTAIDIVNSIEHPLALYIFTDKREQIDRVLTETRSGSVTANDLGSQYFNPNLPFGGVGQSGMGNYHGKYSVDTFSHHRSVFLRNVKRL